ncbi:cupin domain-containing protein [Geminocystis sp. GBBB08]|uniref:cupin domain-containing protein n=1 Tax=Geminocystis sp. GBBB08 TaxID=2604140 RepID=UPI0027E353FF|nr:cupin domain-containing protein [Geminocystis sp. GBBB08]MBL1210745.1 cupin domain-containing protein [Geminocystis sp. GBBB08]
MNAEYWIKKLNLQKHPEGGYYRETYRSQDMINQDKSLIRYDNSRNACTAIYYLLLGEEFSAFHKLKSDEIFHFYQGSSLIVHLIDNQGEYSQFKLGNNPDNDEVLQLVIPHSYWFASNVSQPNSYSLIGCTVSPGFDFADFTLGNQEELTTLYPSLTDVIIKLTHS